MGWMPFNYKYNNDFNYTDKKLLKIFEWYFITGNDKLITGNDERFIFKMNKVKIFDIL